MATPLTETASTALGVLDHVTTASLMTDPFASRTTAVAASDCPMRSVDEGTLMVMLLGAETGVAAVTRALPATPSTLAVITADPAFSADTTPVALTFAMVVSDEVQEIGGLVTTAPAESFTVAVACWVCPMVRVLGTSDTETDATGILRAVVGGIGFVLPP
jgi:hypothetical protein